MVVTHFKDTLFNSPAKDIFTQKINEFIQYEKRKITHLLIKILFVYQFVKNFSQSLLRKINTFLIFNTTDFSDFLNHIPKY